MSYFPFFVDIEDKQWLIVGGGPVALRKAQDLLPYGAIVRVVAPAMNQGLKDMQGSVELVERSFAEQDLEGMDFVVAATSDPSLNSRISEECRRRRIPVNVVDVKGECSFIFPSIVREGPVTIGISTGGMSPVIARWLKKRIGDSLPENLGVFTMELGAWRDRVKALFPSSPEVRSSLFYELAQAGLDNNGCLNPQTAETIIQRKLEQEHE